MEPRLTPDEVRAEVVQRMPAGTVDREGWARDIQVAFFAQGIAPSPENLCAVRSEEHTSELQSLMRISYAVFCLKKKKNIQLTITDNDHEHSKTHNINPHVQHHV